MDAATFGADVVAAVRSFLEQEIDPLVARIADLEKQLAEMPKPKDGKDGADGKSVMLEDVAPLLAEEVAKAFAEIRLPEDGKPGKDADPELIKTMVTEAIAALPAAEKGKDADPAETEEMVVKHVERVLAGWERPKNGIDGKDGAPGADGKDGATGLNGKDGADAIDAMIDRDGNLVFTLSDGRMKNVGLVVGRDGAAGKDGIKGADGIDGVGFDDMTCEVRDDGVYLVWEKGELVKEARLPIPMDRGIYKQGQTYGAGDGVTWGGSFWIAQEETAEKPDTGKGWRLAVKKGRDGKDAPDPKKGK